jgi:hypothetical protein
MAERRQADNERAAATALKQIAAAEADFRANDRDANWIQDYWTGDVASLYSIQVDGRPLALIGREVADADRLPIRPRAGGPVPFHGYYFAAMETDVFFQGGEYKQDTGSAREPRGKVHHPSEYGFCAYPAEFGVTGVHTFFINEGNTVLRADLGGKPLLRMSDAESCLECGDRSHRYPEHPWPPYRDD